MCKVSIKYCEEWQRYNDIAYDTTSIRNFKSNKGTKMLQIHKKSMKLDARPNTMAINTCVKFQKNNV